MYCLVDQECAESAVHECRTALLGHDQEIRLAVGVGIERRCCDQSEGRGLEAEHGAYGPAGKPFEVEGGRIVSGGRVAHNILVKDHEHVQFAVIAPIGGERGRQGISAVLPERLDGYGPFSRLPARVRIYVEFSGLDQDRQIGQAVGGYVGKSAGEPLGFRRQGGGRSGRDKAVVLSQPQLRAQQQISLLVTVNIADRRSVAGSVRQAPRVRDIGVVLGPGEEQTDLAGRAHEQVFRSIAIHIEGPHEAGCRGGQDDGIANSPAQRTGIQDVGHGRLAGFQSLDELRQSSRTAGEAARAVVRLRDPPCGRFHVRNGVAQQPGVAQVKDSHRLGIRPAHEDHYGLARGHAFDNIRGRGDLDSDPGVRNRSLEGLRDPGVDQPVGGVDGQNGGDCNGLGVGIDPGYGELHADNRQGGMAGERQCRHAGCCNDGFLEFVHDFLSVLYRNRPAFATRQFSACSRQNHPEGLGKTVTKRGKRAYLFNV